MVQNLKISLIWNLKILIDLRKVAGLKYFVWSQPSPLKSGNCGKILHNLTHLKKQFKKVWGPSLHVKRKKNWIQNTQMHIQRTTSSKLTCLLQTSLNLQTFMSPSYVKSIPILHEGLRTTVHYNYCQLYADNIVLFSSSLNILNVKTRHYSWM